MGRVQDAATGATLAPVEQTLVSFQAASDGIPCKSLKWLAQEHVPRLLERAAGLWARTMDW